MSIAAPAGFRHVCAHGVELGDDGQARFALWAPNARRVELLLEDRVLPMQREADGFYRLSTLALAGDAYRYRIDGDLAVPDPAARAQRGDIDGPSVVVDPAAYAWRCSDWIGHPWHEAVICELHVGILGGFDGVRRELPRLAAAGYTVIELMPIGEFPGGRNWGYDGVLCYAPEASYGSPDALKALVDEAHRLGLGVLLDVVYNHFGPAGNFLPGYAASFFREDRPTPWGPAIDFRQAAVRQFFIDNALMWLNEYRFDGLRFDAVHTITPASFLDELGASLRGAVAPERQIHLILENEHNTAGPLERDFDAQWNDDGHNALHALLTGEHEGYYADYAEDPTARLATVLAEGFAFQGQPDRRGHPRGTPSGHLPASAFVLFLQNHDQIGNRPLGDRLASLIEPAMLAAATALVALSPMVPMFFIGDEWASRTPFLFFTSHREELGRAVREGRRAEFAHFSGFSDPARREAIPDPNAPATFEASVPADADGDGARTWAAWFTHLLRLRQKRLTPHLRDARPLGCARLGDGALQARWRLADGRVLELAFNLGRQPVSIEAGDGELFYRCGGADTQWLPPASLLARLLDEAV